MHPLDKAAYHVEYVARHRGAPFLKPTYKNLYWFQFYLLDVMLAAIIAILLFTGLCYKLVKILRQYYKGVGPVKPKSS